MKAQKHGAEDRLHKYWARKPAGLVAHRLAGLVRAGDTVVDPFCGSGVAVREAARLGCVAIGFDANPVAALLTRVTLSPPTLADHDAATAEMLAAVAPLAEAAWGDTRWVVHVTVVRCPGCEREVGADQAAGQSRKWRCPHCGGRLLFNLEHLTRTRVVSGATDLAAEMARSEVGEVDPAFDQPLVENRRILAFKGMRTSMLFTRRNAALLGAAARAAHGDSALLTLTGSVAQCSRLVAFRNGLSTGGPAWSVPGFWVPPIHVESNPMLHLRARAAKVRAAIAARAPLCAEARVECTTAQAGLAALPAATADLVFLDPPYGDSVPYLEFSALWNAFLGPLPSLERDLSVSDREPRDVAWARYRQGLRDVLAEVARVLRPSGAVLVTFNSHDPRAWAAILGALQSAGLACTDAEYAEPAVVSAKAQLAPDGSYTGDIWAVFRPSTATPSRVAPPPVTETPATAAHTRALRNRHLAILLGNVSAEAAL